MRTALILAAGCGVMACSGEKAPPADAAVTDSPPALAPGEGRLAVEGGSIWYRVTGSGPGLPVILIHGGPGYNSFYLKPLEALGDDRPVVRYDQLGSGKSDHVSDTTLFTVERFVRELDALRAHLGYEKFHLLGHSWGTMLGMEYYRAHPDRVASLTLGSAALDIPAWLRNTREMLRTLPDSAQRAVAEAEASGVFDSPGYAAANELFMAKYVVRHPVQVDWDSTLATMNMGIYGYMWGPTEFTATGSLKDFDATPLLPKVTVPTLFTVGEYDEAHPPTIQRQAALVPGGQAVVIDTAAHITTWD
ncbi:MAG TPA: proline iminopeptidase-family hydrolase, partial [Gemmatimonadales bacterium]|nr:proline iminopeptidase-family hydrolase [Gemmatimonadales bacterium]